MEPERSAERLIVMPRRPSVIAAALILSALIFSGLALPVAAQAVPEAPTRMEAVAGMAGFVEGFQPIDVAVTVSSDVLFAGLLEAKLGGVTQALPIEVPAGGSKVYNLRLGNPVGNPQVRLRLLTEDNDEPAATLNLSLKVATDHLIAAVLGPDELVRTIDAAVAAITERDVVGVAITSDRLEEQLDPARYLVLASATELPDETVNWLGGGGRLVVDTADLDALGLDLATGAGNFPFGSGWVIGVEDLAQMTDDEWSDVFSPVAYRFAAREIWQSPENQLMQSAISGGDQRVPTLPWLLAALVGYAILLGPVNFAILKKIGRRELAWATVPVLALAGVIGFWTAGRQRLQEHVVSHASVVIATDRGAEGRTASVLVVGEETSRNLATAEGWDSIPVEAAADFSMQAAAVYARIDPSGGFDFELGQLGAAGLSSRWDAPASSVPQVDARAVDDELEVDIANTTDLSFWTWGVVARGRVEVSDEPLEPGAQGTRSLRPGQNGFNEFGTVGDAVINQLQLWDDPFIWNRLGPLSQVAATMLNERDTYFFGFTDELEVPLSVDGSPAQADGTSLVIVPIDLSQLLIGEDNNTLSAQLLDAGDASFIDFGPGYVYVQGQSAVVGWNVPEGAGNPTLQVNENFGPVPPVLDLYDWVEKSFVTVSNRDVVDLARFRNDRGEVILRASNDIDNFMETGFSPYAFNLEW